MGSRYKDPWAHCHVPFEHGCGMAEAQKVRFAFIARVPPNDCEALTRYDAAESCANRALTLDPKCYKARFRRGQARKGSLQFAAAGVGELTRSNPYILTPTRATETDGWQTSRLS